jgi:hypothetical protein
MQAQFLEGTVHDALTGAPLPGVVLSTNAFSQGPTARTDASGHFRRIDNLWAGRYYIRVYSSDANDWDPRYVPQYLGGTLQPDDSHMVEVKYGETLKNVDVRLARYEGVTVSGRLEGVPANPRGAAGNLQAAIRAG